MNNTSGSKITDEKKTNGSLTDSNNRYHRMTRRQQLFLHRARIINEINGRPFCYADFKYMKPENFRQYIFKLKTHLDVVVKSNPVFYCLKGIKLPGSDKKITDLAMGVGMQFANLLEQLKMTRPMIHDIKIKIKSPFALYNRLVEKGYLVNPSNKMIKLDIPQFFRNVRVKAFLYKNTLLIDLACSFKPLVYDVASIIDLTEYLTTISIYISNLGDITLPMVHEWIITQYHFNKDVAFDGQSAHFTFEEVAAGLIRLYTKKISSGNSILRAEQIQNPQRTVAEELQEALGH